MAVSFSASAKAEVCRVLPHKHCCALAQCFGILLYCNCFTADGIKIITESRDFAYILPKLFKKAFDMDFDSYPSLAAPGKLVFQIWDEEKIRRIMDSFGFSVEDTFALHVNLPVVEEDCCKGAFLRGAFLAGGSVTDPGKGNLCFDAGSNVLSTQERPAGRGAGALHKAKRTNRGFSDVSRCSCRVYGNYGSPSGKGAEQ